MSGTMRRAAVVLASTALAVSVFCVVVLVIMGRAPVATRLTDVRPPITQPYSSQDPENTEGTAGTEQIADEDTPLAAAPTATPTVRKDGATHVVLGCLFGAAGFYLFYRLRRVNASISAMRSEID